MELEHYNYHLDIWFRTGHYNDKVTKYKLTIVKYIKWICNLKYKCHIYAIISQYTQEQVINMKIYLNFLQSTCYRCFFVRSSIINPRRVYRQHVHDRRRSTRDVHRPSDALPLGSRQQQRLGAHF